MDFTHRETFTTKEKGISGFAAFIILKINLDLKTISIHVKMNIESTNEKIVGNFLV